MTLASWPNLPIGLCIENPLYSLILSALDVARHKKSLTVNCFALFMMYWHKVQMSCRQTQPVGLRGGVRFRHGSLFCHQASVRVNSSSAAHALCGIGIAAYVATFLDSIFHLPLFRSYFPSLEKASPIQTCAAGRLRSREHEDPFKNADGWHEWRWFQISDLVFGFSTRSIAHHKIIMLNAE